MADVMRALAGLSFFEKLGDALSPEDESIVPDRCRATYELSEAILRASAIESSDFSISFAYRKRKAADVTANPL